MREIELKHGNIAIVSDEDYPRLSRYRWRELWNRYTRSYYAVRTGREADFERGKTIYMHREVMGLKPGDRSQVDHIESGKTLDNRRENLRLATCAKNQHNQRRSHANSSGFKGVCWDEKKKLFMAAICVGGKRIFLGRRPTAEAAHELYKAAATRHFGEFARFE